MKPYNGALSKKSSQSIDNSFSQSRISGSQSKILSPHRNSYTDLKPKSIEKSTKKSKPEKISFCNSRSPASLTTPTNKKSLQDPQSLLPTVTVQIPNAKKSKEKTQKHQNPYEKKPKKFEESLKPHRTVDPRQEENEEELFHTDRIYVTCNQFQHKSSLSLDFNQFPDKDLSDSKLILKPKPQKSSKLKKKPSDDSKKSSKNSSVLFLKKLKACSVEIPLSQTEDYQKFKDSTQKLVKEKKSSKNLSKPKLKTLRSKPTRKTAQISPRLSNLCPAPKDPKHIKSIMKPSKFSDLSFKIHSKHETSLKSEKSSVVHTEAEEWVNLIDYKFQGAASGFVEEFKAKLSENLPVNKKPMRTFVNTSDDLKTEDLSLSPSESSPTEYKTFSTITSLRPKPAEIPRLDLGEHCNEDSFSSANEANATSEMLEFISSRSCFSISELNPESHIFGSSLKLIPYELPQESLKLSSTTKKK